MSVVRALAEKTPVGAVAGKVLPEKAPKPLRRGVPFKRTIAAVGLVAVGAGGLRACGGQPGTTDVQPGYAALRSVSITANKHQFCDSNYQATVKNVPAKYNKPIDYFPDFGRSQTLTKGNFTADVCVRTESIVGVYDAKKKKFVVHLTTSPNPKVSDLTEIVSPTSNLSVHYSANGSLLQKLLGPAVADINAIPNVNFQPNQNLDDRLRGIALTVAEQQVAGPCGKLALQKLTNPNAPKQSPKGAAATINQDIIDNFIVKSASQYAKYHIPANAWEVDITPAPGPGGLPNQYAAEYQSLVSDGPKHHIKVPSNANLPACHDTTPGSH